MGNGTSCCVANNQQNQQPNKHSDKKPSPLQSLKPTRSSSVPYILNHGTPAYESVVTPKIGKPSNGYVSENGLLEILQKPSNNSDEEKENQPQLPKTLTTPNLDSDGAKRAPEQLWEHTQSLDVIKVLTSEESGSNTVSKIIANKNCEDTTAEKSHSVVVYLENINKSSNSETFMKSQIVKEAEHTLNSSLKEEDIKIQNHEKCSTSIEKQSTQPNGTNKSIIVRMPSSELNTANGSNQHSPSNYYNIFDIEFRRHNEAVSKSNYNTLSSTYTEAHASSVAPLNENENIPEKTIDSPTKISLESQLPNTEIVKEASEIFTTNRLYSSVVKKSIEPN